MRAIAERDDLTVSFAPGQHGLFGTEARLPPPAHELPPNEVANVRGEADAIALKLRHHNAMLHAREAPSGEMARAVFDAVEQARVEAIGARQMVGVSENLSAALSEHCRQRGFARVTERGDGPLPEVIRLLVREALTGTAPPREAKRMVDLWRPNMSDQVRSDLVKRHLRESDLPLSEVAELLGFATSSSFSHWFQGQFGCSASQWIKQATGVAAMAA